MPALRFSPTMWASGSTHCPPRRDGVDPGLAPSHVGGSVLVLCHQGEVRRRAALPDGRSHHFPVGDVDAVVPCYPDLMYLWVGRDINNHIFPYIHGGIGPNGHLFGGVVEYPVLSGMLMYLGAIGATTDTEFFQHSALLLAPFAFAITIMLALMTRWWVLLWAATPPLVLYAFHNWELPVVATAVGAVAVMAGASTNPRTGERRLRYERRRCSRPCCWESASLKLYPGAFALPLALYVLTRRGRHDQRASSNRRSRLTGAIMTAAAAAVTVIAIQLPFMIVGFEGWKAALFVPGQAEVRRRHQLHLVLGTSTFHRRTDRHVQLARRHVVTPADPVRLRARGLSGVACVPAVGHLSVDRRLGCAMLAGFMLLHKVH